MADLQTGDEATAAARSDVARWLRVSYRAGAVVDALACWLCGIRLSAALMVADGGAACAEVRWFCRDIQGCTERWTSRPAGLAGTTAAPETGKKKRAG